ncbi:hypothetical protein HELRODRAFT_175486 [Helobdella robusta]|uniref:Uncharacterized protein n=1 Tax=Helobdella robusta TaxID=6412 RepID=T1F9B2_HELRO|nr:hypothetical protein HELRODRAFT_175486 [Helobdella robusta]ESO00529.1 hypothetical protein HELRODRAFT_175486 [Helobdella robusta]
MDGSIKLELLNYADTSSIRGISKFFKSKDAFLKTLWFLSFVVSMSFMIYLLDESVGRYNRRSITTRYGEKIGKNVQFPDITLCNLDPFAEGYTGLPVSAFFASVRNHKNLVIDEYKKIMEANKNQSLKAIDVNKVFEKFDSVSGLILSLNKNRPKSDDCPNFITDCTIFDSDWFEIDSQCSAANFTRHWNANYYTCYTLKTSDLQISNSTIIRGLSLLINIGPPNVVQIPYKSSLTNSQARGVQVSVHNPDIPPDLRRGFSLASGTENIIQIVQTDVIRQNKAENKVSCTDKSKMPFQSSVKYNSDLCKDYCQQKIIQRKCGCMTHLLAIPEDEIDKAELCGNFSAFFSFFIDSVPFNKVICSLVNISQEDIDFCKKECLIPCNETKYDTYLSSATWPQPSVQMDIFRNFIKNCTGTHHDVRYRYRNYNEYDDYENQFKPLPIKNLTQIQESLLEIKFVMNQNSPNYQYEKFTYTWQVMTGNIGGMLSLWTGITVVSAVEVIELVYLVLKRWWKSKKLAPQAKEIKINEDDEIKNPKNDFIVNFGNNDNQ